MNTKYITEHRKPEGKERAFAGPASDTDHQLRLAPTKPRDFILSEPMIKVRQVPQRKAPQRRPLPRLIPPYALRRTLHARRLVRKIMERPARSRNSRGLVLFFPFFPFLRLALLLSPIASRQRSREPQLASFDRVTRAVWAGNMWRAFDWRSVDFVQVALGRGIYFCADSPCPTWCGIFPDFIYSGEWMSCTNLSYGQRFENWTFIQGILVRSGVRYPSDRQLRFKLERIDRFDQFLFRFESQLPKTS